MAIISAMRKSYLILILVMIFSVLMPSESFSRRNRRKKRIKLQDINGTISVSVKSAGDTISNNVKSIEKFRRRAYWRFYDPLIVLPDRFPVQNRMFVFLSGKGTEPTAAVSSDTEEDSRSEEKIEMVGGGFKPRIVLLSTQMDFRIYNLMARTVNFLSPGRVIRGKPMKTEKIVAGGDMIFNVRPRSGEQKEGDFFWSYPLAAKEFPLAKGRVVFIKSKFYSNLTEGGAFLISQIPPGQYTLHVVYINKVVHTQKIEIRKKGKVPPVKLKVTVPILKSEL
ncbi:MAG: hypothetical protein JXR95_07200 [Deltaproteobacteria bacterium]|nr:hypothetical protein [Deltaproteobacteria bacterium]